MAASSIHRPPAIVTLAALLACLSATAALPVCLHGWRLYQDVDGALGHDLCICRVGVELDSADRRQKQPVTCSSTVAPDAHELTLDGADGVVPNRLSTAVEAMPVHWTGARGDGSTSAAPHGHVVNCAVQPVVRAGYVNPIGSNDMVRQWPNRAICRAGSHLWVADGGCDVMHRGRYRHCSDRPQQLPF